MSFDLKLINNGLALNPDGTLQTVSDNAKLAQDMLKITITSAGTNKIFNWYGSFLGARVIGNVLTTSQLDTEIRRSIQEVLQNLIAIQKSQARTQYVSAGETIASIYSIDVLQSESDPREYEISITVLTNNLTVVEESFTLRLTR